MNRRLVLSGLGLLAVVLPLLPAAAAGAQAQPPVTSVGWWTDRVLAQEKGDDGFEVARTLDGSSVAAATIETDGTVTSAAITLIEAAEGSIRPDSAAIEVCSGRPFEAADPGDLADAPVTECTAGVPLERAGDGTWTGDVSSLVRSGTSVLAIVPGPVPADAQPLDPGFVVSFEAPVIDLTVGSGGGVDSTTPAGTLGPPEFSSPGPATGPPSSGFTAGPSPAFDMPDIESAPVTAVAPPVDGSTAESTEIAGPTLNSSPISGGSGDPRPWIRLLVLVPFSAATGAAAVFGRRRLGPATV